MNKLLKEQDELIQRWKAGDRLTELLTRFRELNFGLVFGGCVLYIPHTTH